MPGPTEVNLDMKKVQHQLVDTLMQHHDTPISCFAMPQHIGQVASCCQEISMYNQLVAWCTTSTSSLFCFIYSTIVATLLSIMTTPGQMALQVLSSVKDCVCISWSSKCEIACELWLVLEYYYSTTTVVVLPLFMAIFRKTTTVSDLSVLTGTITGSNSPKDPSSRHEGSE